MRTISLYQKKGQTVNSMGPIMLTLVFAAIVLVFGIIISQSLRDIDTIKSSESASVSNETLTTVSNVTAENVATYATPGFGGLTVSLMYNSTDAILIDSGNYTVYSNGSIVATALGAQSSFNNTNWLVTYSYTYGGGAYLAANETIVGLGTFANFWEIIVLAIVITIVLGLLIVVFGRQGRR